ncbi:hypothetical protein CsSME_00000868 [Camellia sinensis var. sinensis]
MLSELAGVDDSEEVDSECAEDCVLGCAEEGVSEFSVLLVCAEECVLGLCSGVCSWSVQRRVFQLGANPPEGCAVWCN